MKIINPSKKQKPMVSIVIVACGGTLEYTVKAIQSLVKYTNVPYELIVVDNASMDGTTGYLKSIGCNYIRIPGNEPVSYGKALNKGLKQARGDFIVISNNDVVFTPNWCQYMLACFKDGKKLIGVSKVGIVGPMSNAVGYEQRINPQYLIDQRYSDKEEDIIRFSQWWAGQVWNDKSPELQFNCNRTGMLVGFCWMMSKECYEEIGEFAEFSPGGFEDNDYCYRASLKGYALIISHCSYVHHEANATFKAWDFKEARNGMALRRTFYDKFDRSNEEKLLAIGILADTIKDEEKKRYIELMNGNDRNLFINKNEKELFISMAYSGADWLIVLGEHEKLEPRVSIDMIKKLMNPKNPMTFAYNWRVITAWDRDDRQRIDDIFADRLSAKLIRNIKGYGLEDGKEPRFPNYNVKPCQYRIYDYTYLTKEMRINEYNKLTTEQQKNYECILDDAVQIIPIQDNMTLGLITLVKDEMRLPECHLETFLDHYHTIYDEMIIVDTGSTDNSVEVAEYYGATVYKKEWHEDFSEIRNFAKSQCSCTWLNHADPDERFGDNVLRLRAWMEVPVLAYKIAIRHPVIGMPLEKSVKTYKARLFRNLPEIYYQDEVHEEVESSLMAMKQDRRIILIEDIPGMPFQGIYHYGNNKDPELVKEKKQNYHDICEKMLEKNPNHGYANYSIAVDYVKDRNYEKAFEHFEKAIASRPKFGHTYIQASRTKLLEGEEYLIRALQNVQPNTNTYREIQIMLQEISKMSLRILDR